MVISLRLHPTDEIRQSYENTLSSITAHNWLNALHHIRNLKAGIRKYYMSRGLDYTPIKRIFEEIETIIVMDRNSNWKEEELETLLTKLVVQLSGSKPTGNPYEELKKYYEALFDVFSSFLSHGKFSYLTEIHDILSSIGNLEPLFANEDRAVYKRFRKLLEKTGSIDAKIVGMLSKVQTIRQSLKNILINDLAELLSDMKALFAPKYMEEPTEGKRKKEVSVEEIIDMLEKGMTPEEIAEKTGLELNTIQQIINRVGS